MMKFPIILLIAATLISCGSTLYVYPETSYSAPMAAEPASARPEWIGNNLSDDKAMYLYGCSTESWESAEKSASGLLEERIRLAFDKIQEKYGGLSGTEAFSSVMLNLEKEIIPLVSQIESLLVASERYEDGENYHVLMELDRNSANDAMFSTWKKASKDIPLFQNDLIAALADNAAKKSISEFF